MKKISMLVLTVSAFAFFLSSPTSLHAELIKHHGMMVKTDATAEDCISCHDGSIAHIVSYCTVLCDFSTSHVILKHYPPPMRKPGEFASTAAIAAKGIKLQNGMVTCLSCHNLKNPGKNHLVVDNARSNLCKICHIKK